MQYSESLDDFVRMMKEGNNGGYANTWLVGDRKTNEIGRLELGLKYVTFDRTRDGYFVGSNFPINPKLARAKGQQASVESVQLTHTKGGWRLTSLASPR